MPALTQLLADVGGWHQSNGWHNSGWWVVFPILWLSLLAAVIALFWRRRQPHVDPARQILGERFARGEITLDEYRDRLSQLQ